MSGDLDKVTAGLEAFAFTGEETKGQESDVLGVLLSGVDDDPEAVEASAGELAVLEDEFGTIATLVRRKEDLEEKLSAVDAELAAQRARMLDAMEAQGPSQFKGVSGPGSCSITTRFDTIVEDPATFLTWVQERHPELLTVNAQTRTSFIRKEYKSKGMDPSDEAFPPGIKVTERKNLMVRGVKRGKAKRS